MDDRDTLFAALSAAENEIDRLRQQLFDLQQELRDRDRTIQQARDIDPVKRPSLSRVRKLAEAAFMWVLKVPSARGKGKGFDWVLTFGKPVGFDLTKYVVMCRRFRSLREIWDILVSGFCLNDLFDGFLKTGRPKPISRAQRLAKQTKRFFYDPDEYSFFDNEQRAVLQNCEQFYSQTYDCDSG